MKTKNIVPVTEARKNIFSIVDHVQKPNVHYTLTERGKPRAVIVSIDKFEKMLGGNGGLVLADGNGGSYAGSNFSKFPGTLIIRDESRIVYLSARDQETKMKEESLIKAQLYIEIIETYGYPVYLVDLGRYVRIGRNESRRYIEADAIINDQNGNVNMIFEVSYFDDYEKNMDIIVEDLFDLADSLSWAKRPQYLVYFSRKCRNKQTSEKITVVDCSKFRTFLAWKKAGRQCLNEVPRYGEGC